MIVVMIANNARFLLHYIHKLFNITARMAVAFKLFRKPVKEAKHKDSKIKRLKSSLTKLPVCVANQWQRIYLSNCLSCCKAWKESIHNWRFLDLSVFPFLIYKKYGALTEHQAFLTNKQTHLTQGCNCHGGLRSRLHILSPSPCSFPFFLTKPQFIQKRDEWRVMFCQIQKDLYNVYTTKESFLIKVAKFVLFFS